MNYNKLNYFVTVAQTLNISKAANQLYMNHSVVSRHISDLEKELQIDLFIRTNRNLILTPAGEMLYNTYAPMFAQEKDVLQKIRNMREREHNCLTLSFLNTRFSNALMRVRDDFQKKYPHIQLQYQRREWGTVIQDVESGEADVGIVVHNEDESQYSDDMDSIVLMEDCLSLIVPKQHPFAKLSEVALEQLRNESILTVNRHMENRQYDSTLRLLKSAGIHPNIAGEYTNIDSTLLMVGAGAGVSIQSRFAPIDSIQNIVSIPISNAPAITLELFWRKGTYNTTLGYFIDLVLRHIQ